MVARATEPERVLKLLTDVSRSIPSIEKHPAPSALFVGFGESGLNFELRYWLQVGTPPEVESGVALAVASELRKADIEVPVPQRDLYLRSVSTDFSSQTPQESGDPKIEDPGQKPSALDRLTVPSPSRTLETDPSLSTLRKSAEFHS